MAVDSLTARSPFNQAFLSPQASFKVALLKMFLRLVLYNKKMRNLPALFQLTNLVVEGELDLSDCILDDSKIPALCEGLNFYEVVNDIRSLQLRFESPTNSESNQLIITALHNLRDFDQLTLKGPMSNELINLILGKTKVKKLYVESSTIDDLAFSNLKDNQNLISLTLINGNLTDKSFSQIYNHPSLKRINIQNQNLNDQVVQNLATNTNLKELYLRSDTITDQVANPLSSNTTLNILEISSKKITSKFIKPFKKNITLEQLILYAEKIFEGQQLFADDPMHPNYKFCHKNLLALAPAEFKKIILNNQAKRQMVLREELLQNKLNALGSPNQTSTLKQGFTKSCAASSIMYVLDKFGKLNNNKDYVTELKIYEKIWNNPDDIADLQKIIDFLDKMDIKTKYIEDPKFKNGLIQYEIYHKLYQEQRAKITKPIIEMDFEIISAGYFLLVTLTRGGPHIITGHIDQKTKGLLIFDSGKDQKFIFQGFIQFVKYWEKTFGRFTGIALEIIDPRPMAALKRSGEIVHSNVTPAQELSVNNEVTENLSPNHSSTP